MSIRRAHVALAVVLAGAALTLTGCSDDSPAASSPAGNGTQPTQSSQPTQPTQSVAGANDDETTPPADDNGGGGDYCAVLEKSGDAFSGWQQAGTKGAKEQEVIAKTFDDLAAKAPGDIKPAMTDIAKGYRLVSTGQIGEDDKDQITKFATAIQTVNKWIPAHCPGLDIDLEGPAS
jgi:hypothetical protein